jgi:ferredoxin, 2Fe-2S
MSRALAQARVFRVNWFPLRRKTLYRAPASPPFLHRISPEDIVRSRMPNITFIDYEGTARTVEGEVGSTVMETAIKNGVPGIEAECGGACACATCHVHVDDAWRAAVGEPSPMETDMLDFGYDVRPNSRLSCQIKVVADLDGLVVRTPERQA